MVLALFLSFLVSLAINGHSFGQTDCTLTTDSNGGGTITVQGAEMFDSDLEIDIGPNLSYVRLENSEMYIEYSPFVNPHAQFAIRSLVVKAVGQDQMSDSDFDYLGAGAGIGTIDSATITYDGADRKTVRMIWNRWDVVNQVADDTKKIIRDITIFPHSRFIKTDFVDLQWAVNLADLGRPGGVSNGLHVAHGGDTWPRGYITHDEPPGVFYSRYVPNGVGDPVDGGSLNYNDHFITAVYNPANGIGFGRVMPIEHTHVIKLLLHPGARRGLEFQNYPFLLAHPPFTGWIYVFTNGAPEALDTGRALADQNPEGFDCGQELQVTALPYTNWGFTGWGGDLSGLVSPAPLVLSGDMAVTADFEKAPGFLSEDFESYLPGVQPTNFVDTGANNSLVEDDSLFATESDADGTYFATNSTATNIHSTVTGVSFENGYYYTGRMRITSSQSGIGLTFFSQFPGSHDYYRLRRFNSTSFHLTASGTAFTGGTTDTGVVPTTNEWYRFTIRVEDTGSETDIKARVWRDGTEEPSFWQVDAVDASATRLTGGTVGLWSFTSGSKHFDELIVRSLTPPLEFTLTTSVTGQGSVERTPDQPSFAFGDTAVIEAVPDTEWRFTGWTGDIISMQNPLTVAMADDVSVTATFEEIQYYTVTTATVGQGLVTLDPDQPLYETREILTVEGVPAGGWAFTGWTGGLTGTDNPLTFAVTGDTVATANFVELTSSYDENFESYVAGDNPPDWVDTGALNSLTPTDVFNVQSEGGNEYLQTTSGLTNIHSHTTSTTARGSGYQFTGRMRMGSSSSGIGVTFFSQFPDSAGYYRLRRYGSNSFHLSALGTMLQGDTETGVVPTANVWYQFRVEVKTHAAQTSIRARVWQQGAAEPTTWQASATDSSTTRFTEGTIGVWSYLAGQKCWDDFSVLPLDTGPPPPPETYTLDVLTTGNGSVTVDPVVAEYDAGTPVELTAVPDPGWLFAEWQGSTSGTTNPKTFIMVADSTITAVFQEIVQHSITTSTVGMGSVTADPDVTELDSGSTITFTATPDAGWLFVGWQGTLSGTTNPLTVTVGADVVATAEFIEITQHTIDVTTVGQGVVTFDPDLALYDLFTDVSLTATADAGWVFTGWSGDLTSNDNPLNINVETDLALTATFVEQTGYFEDFQSYAAGSNPTGWLDTDAQNSLSENDSLFSVFQNGANTFLGTNSTAVNIHSHYVGGALPAGGYEFSGRIRMTASQAGIGVTFFSDYPNSNKYYRLRRYFGNSFHITANGSAISGGNVDSFVVPQANQWYSFRIEVEDTGLQTNIRGRVWLDGTVEPTDWPINCFDSSPSRLTSGTIGVWTFHTGAKWFDDFAVEPIDTSPPPPPPTDLVLTVSAVGDGVVDVNPDLFEYTQGDLVDVTATPDPGWQFLGWSGDVSSSDNPLTITMVGDVSVTANFGTIPTGADYVEDFSGYPIGGNPTDWLDTQAGNSLLPGDDFAVADFGGNPAFHTQSTGTNIHSHYTGVLPAGGYELRGRMRTGASSSGIGVTFFSDFPNTVRYYRLRRYFTNSFHIAPVGTSVAGTIDSGVVPSTGPWYRYVVRVEDTGARTEIRAKVWADGTGEPLNWQIDCFDDTASRLTDGKIGVWGFHSGSKSWDDFEVSPLN